MVRPSSGMLILLLLRLVALWLCMTSSMCAENQVYSRIFQRGTLCHMEERLRLVCSQEKPYARNLFDCLRLCNQKDLCVGASMEKTSQSCVLHEMCSPSLECGPADTRHDYWQSYCLHGHWDSITHSCECLFQTYGDRCDQYLKKCPDGPVYQPALIDLQEDINEVDPMMVVCNSRFTEVLRNSGNIDFNRTYEEYVRGFWADSNNFWTGLKHWHRLSSKRYTKLGVVVHFDGGSAQMYAIYSVFEVLGENDGFVVRSSYYASSHEGSVPPGGVGDCFSPIQNTSFSAWNTARGVAGDENCASLAGSGWWHSACDNPCNLLGWGLDDWDDTPPRQRLSVDGLDVQTYAGRIDSVKIHLELR